MDKLLVRQIARDLLDKVKHPSNDFKQNSNFAVENLNYLLNFSNKKSIQNLSLKLIK